MARGDSARERAQKRADELRAEVLAHPDRLPSGSAGLLAEVVALLVVVTTVALVPLGIWLLVALPNRLIGVIGGVLLLALAWQLRPRTSLPEDAVRLDSAPEVRRLIADVAAAVGTRPAKTVVVVPEPVSAVYDAYGRDGRVLVLGAPQWLAATPQARVALLAHEHAHFSSGDTRRGRVVGAAMTVLWSWQDLLDDRGGATYGHWNQGQQRTSMTEDATGLNGMVAIAGLLARVVLWVVGLVPLALGRLLLAITVRDSQRSEYRADRASVAVAGNDGAVAMLRLVQRAAGLDAALQRAAIARADVLEAARAFDPTADTGPTAPGWHDTVDLFDTHPPLAYRIEAVQAQPLTTAAVVLDSSRAAAVEAELAPAFAKVERRVRDSYLG